MSVKDVTGSCKLIHGCSLALLSVTVSVVSAGICYRNELNPYLPEVGYNIPQACLVAKLSLLPTFEKSFVPHD